MKAHGFLLFCILISYSSREQIPLYKGVGSTHIYSEIDESSFYISGLAGDGRMFAHAHTGSLYLIGNNYIKKIRFANNEAPLHCSVWETDSNRFIVFTGDAYAIVGNDSVGRFKKSPSDYFVVFKSKGSFFGYADNKLYQWKSDSFVLWHHVKPGKGIKSNFYLDTDNNIWHVERSNTRADFYVITEFSKRQFQFSIHNPDHSTWDDYIELKSPQKLSLLLVASVGIQHTSNLSFKVFPPEWQDHYFIAVSNSYSTLICRKCKNKDTMYVPSPGLIMNQNLKDTATGTYYFSSYTKPFRYFPYLKKYTGIYSAAVSKILQDDQQRIWVGSYDGGLTILDSTRTIQKWDHELKFMPAGFFANNRAYLCSEKTGLRFFESHLGRIGRTFLHDTINIYSSYYDKEADRFYLGTGPWSGLLTARASSLLLAVPSWEKIDSTKGLHFRSMTSLSKDRKGRIWIGNATRGMGVYYPHKKTAQTWLIEKNEIRFGAWSTCVDKRGTVWMGSREHGLFYYTERGSDVIDPKDFKQFEHPLLTKGTTVIQLVEWRDWLIIGTGNDMLILDLDKWYLNNERRIRYINPQEETFKPMPEQNSIYVDRRDSTVWFASSQMLYQWDLERWLSIPTWTVSPNVVLITKQDTSLINKQQTVVVPPQNNTLRLTIWFQSRDNMPRYMSAALIRKGDTLSLPYPSLQTEYRYENLAAGKYEFIVQICESDGSVSWHIYIILIKKYFWQNWWVWLLISLMVFVPFIFWFRLKNRLKLERERAKRELINLQVVSLSNQFRPHFILNALNTIGAELDDKPQAETVLSRLGESINLIFDHTQHQRIMHPLFKEWKLVQNSIDIHRAMYLKKLEVTLPSETALKNVGDYYVPLGLLQVPVENALLHGLNNREEGPWKLYIHLEIFDETIQFTITDNGVGREKAATLSNFRKHGTGSKNMESILQILNKENISKILIAYTDNIYTDDKGTYGTTVTISIPKNFIYGTGNI